MWIKSINIENIRNLSRVELQFSRGLNLILGENGVGKTSILESVFLLGHGKSFRSHLTKNILQSNTERFLVQAHGHLDSDVQLSFGIEKGLNLSRYRLNGSDQKKFSSLANYIPILVFEPGSHSIVTGSSGNRRRLVDWGAFHVKPTFLNNWRSMNRLLKQRNSSLKRKEYDSFIWDQQFIIHAEELTREREIYFKCMNHFYELIKPKLSGYLEDISLEFTRGWSKDDSLENVFVKQRASDRKRGFTHSGPHRADIIFKKNNRIVVHQLSRGQAKILALSLLLAQISYMNSISTEKPIVLLDDFSSELDSQHQTSVLNLLQKLELQVMLTGTYEANTVKAWESHKKVFHVEQGGVVQYLSENEILNE